MASNQSLPPILFKVGDRVRITYVPGAVINISEGITGTVISVPQIVARMVQVEVKLDDGREIWWPQENLEKIAEYFPENPKRLKPEPVTIGVAASRPENKFIPSICIDPEFKSLIPPLSDEERSQLEANLLREGCRDRLVIWKGHNILLDGHNRLEICTLHGIGFDVSYVDLPDRSSAINWIIELQLGRRNLTPEAMSYLRGKRFHLEKRQGQRTDLTSHQNDGKLIQNEESLKATSHQNDGKLDTAARMASQYKVGKATIERDAKFASAIDTIAEVVGNSIRPDLLSRHAKLTKKHTLELASLALESPDLVKLAFSDKTGEIIDVVEQIKRRVDKRANIPFPFRVGEVCLILPQGDKDLRKYKGCWGIVKEIYEFSCLVTVWNTEEVILAEKNLKSLEYTETEQEEKRAISLRLANIVRAGGMEEAVIASNLRFFGTLQRSYLTETEAGMLSWIEQKLNINA